MTHTLHILPTTLATLLLTAACTSDIADVQLPDANQGAEKREIVNLSFTASIADAADNAPASRVAYSQGTGSINRHWETDEQLGVYIKKTDGSILRAGTITGNGETSDVTREFNGDVAQALSGETYIYVHPCLDDTDDDADPATACPANAAISYTTQSGALGSTDHLSDILPLVWRNGSAVAELQGHIFHLVLTFKDNPGTISAVTLQTMAMGTDGTTPDRAFPANFQAARLANDVNATLPAAKTRGTDVADATNYTGALTLNVSGTNTAIDNGDGTYTVEAYLASADIAGIDVFRSKYNVKVTATNGTFYSDYKSFPGQTTTTADAGLPMLANGKSYRLSAKMSKGYAPTIINEQFKVNSLLGMWNRYGKAYDPQHLIADDASQWPSQLQDIIGDATKQASVKARVTSQTYGGTPSWLGPAAGSLYATGRDADLKQEDVTFNNIQITAPTEVFFTIVSEYGWNQNLIGYYTYPTASEGSASSNSVTKNIIFADVSKPGNEPFNSAGNAANNVGTNADAPIREFETVRLLYTDANGYTSTTFPAGTTIGFFMMIDPQANIIVDGDGNDINGYDHRQYDLMRWDQWRLFTNSAWNAQNTLANGAKVNWPSTGYPNSNFFASGDICSTAGSTPADASAGLIPGLAIYGVKDNGTNNNSYAYGAMIFMVSTSDADAMTTQNRAAFNLGTGSLVIAKP